MSRWSDVIYFDTESTSVENGMGDVIVVPGKPRMVFANKKSVRQNEFYQAQALGLRPELMFEIRSFEYTGEEKLEFDDHEYSIIRTYDRGETIELICQGAVNNGNA